MTIYPENRSPIEDKLKISLVTPCYQAGEFLDSCIESIKAQNYDNLEFIIVDGGSDDDTRSIVEKHRDTVSIFISEPDDGMYDAINKGFSRATGDIFCWLNVDDFFFPNCLESINEIFSKFSRVMWISGYRAILDGRVITGVQENFCPRELVRLGLCNNVVFPFLMQETIFWRRECWEQCGTFPSEVRLAGDFWLWQQFSKRWELYYVEALLGCFRRRAGQLSEAFREDYEAEVRQFSEAEIARDSKYLWRTLKIFSFFWPFLRWIPKAKGVFLRIIGEDAASFHIIKYNLERGWHRRKVFIWERISFLDNLFNRIGRR